MDYFEYFSAPGSDPEEGVADWPRNAYSRRYEPLRILHEQRLTDVLRHPKAVIPEDREHGSVCRVTASGDHFNNKKDVFCVDEASVGRVVRRAISSLYSVRDRYIASPSTMEQVVDNAREFAETARYPNIGCLDGAHIPLSNVPQDKESIYVCRRGGHLIDFQIVCNGNCVS